MVALAVAGPLLLAGCGATAVAGDRPAHAPDLIAPVAGVARTPMVRISPADGSAQLPPDSKVTVSAQDGRLEHVDLSDAAGNYLPGDFDPDHKTWTATDPLAPGQNFVVDALAKKTSGATEEQRAGLSTAPVPEADRLAIASVTPSDGKQIGVAYPLIVTFNRPVHNRKAVSDALEVATSPHVEGAWFWMDAQTVDYRPENFWTAGTVVALHANLAGVAAGDNLWGMQDTTSAFTVARSQIIAVDLQKDRMTVQRDGQTVGDYPVSAGKPGWRTRDGIMTIMEKDTDKTWTNTAIDAPEAYVLHSRYAMRITNSGEFIHDAPWNTGKIGEFNASHGCVGMLTSDMAALFAETMIGDAVIVTGSNRPFGTVANRIGDWNLPWAQWVGGNYDLSYR
ncbi:MAG TPA: Ig-like domain-containing protein [Sporichthyaceae bacterium]|jgi:lipoprotein-anchoring transpeptidase ErfK/SrfK|nr:Ig-like domain-containing protein [Sporichthyaceae bacterium]